MSFAPKGARGEGRRGGAGAAGTTRSTVQYGATAQSRGLGGGAPTFGSAHSTKGTMVAQVCNPSQIRLPYIKRAH